MKYQFRAKPPNDDIILDNAHEGYNAPNEDAAWAMLNLRLTLSYEEQTHIRSRYSLEPFIPEHRR